MRSLSTNWDSDKLEFTLDGLSLSPTFQVVPDPEKPLSGFKFKCLYDKEQKGPVTEIDCILGHIISAIGQKIYVWSFLNNDLVGVAFIDTQIYIHRYKFTISSS